MGVKNTNNTILILSLSTLLLIIINLSFLKDSNLLQQKERLVDSEDEISASFFPNEGQLNIGDTVEVQVTINTEKADLFRVADLSFAYDDNILEFISASPDDFFVNPTFFKKDEWKNKRFVLLANSVNLNLPIIKLTFKALDVSNFGTVKLLPESQVYVSQVGAKNIPSTEFSYKVLQASQL